MTFEADLKTHLQSDTAISALVADRIHPLKLDDGATLPAITFQQIADDPQSGLDGDDGNLIRYRIQINVWASGSNGYMDAKALAELVRIRLQTEASTFSAVPEPSGQDVYEPNTKRFGFLRDFSIWYRSTT